MSHSVVIQSTSDLLHIIEDGYLFVTTSVISYPPLFSFWSFRTHFSQFVYITTMVILYLIVFYNYFGQFVTIVFCSTFSYTGHFVPSHNDVLLPLCSFRDYVILYLGTLFLSMN